MFFGCFLPRRCHRLHRRACSSSRAPSTPSSRGAASPSRSLVQLGTLNGSGSPLPVPGVDRARQPPLMPPEMAAAESPPSVHLTGGASFLCTSGRAPRHRSASLLAGGVEMIEQRFCRGGQSPDVPNAEQQHSLGPSVAQRDYAERSSGRPARRGPSVAHPT
jgi:hypothetical protein